LKKAGQGALVAGAGMSLPESALASTNAAHAAEDRQPWPYPVAYGKENVVEADIVILGGGAAGCHAAINAAKRGANVVVVEKGALIRSGCSGGGVDHWHGVLTHPTAKVTPDEMMETIHRLGYKYLFQEYGNGITNYILFNESYDALCDCEKWGVNVRDTKDEFKGAEYRDDVTKLMFAYDYDGKHVVRVKGGADIKLAYFNEMQRLGIKIYDRIMATSLLTEDGKQGNRVIGATGLHTRTGEFYIFKSKATIISTSGPDGLWFYSAELRGASTHGDPNNCGDSISIGWRAGAELALMERVPIGSGGGFGYPTYGSGNASNTYACCNIVDSNGKEVPWVDRDGKPMQTVSQRYHAAPGQKIFWSGHQTSREIAGPALSPDLPDRIRKGEFKLPLYADLAGMPPLERRAIWGLMIYHESKTRIIFETYQKAGFDADKDMLQVMVMPADQYTYTPWGEGFGPRQWKGGFVGGGLLFDWDMRTSLEGLYVAGESNYAGGDHALAATTGRYAGRTSAAYAKTVKLLPVDRGQIEAEKARIYAPVSRTEGLGWNEVRAGMARIMQDYCGESKTKEILELGLYWLKSIKENEFANIHARNPHELWRTVECMSRMDCGEVILNASLNRKASCRALNFTRLDYPQDDPQEWQKLITLKLVNGEIKVGEKPLDYHLQAPYAPTYAENYRRHNRLSQS
jgi:succinate dehydrogenase/fumarate reductase flavoprotein subunit